MSLLFFDLILSTDDSIEHLFRFLHFLFNFGLQLIHLYIVAFELFGNDGILSDFIDERF